MLSLLWLWNPCVLQPGFATHVGIGLKSDGLKFVLWHSLDICIHISQLAWSGSASVVGFILRGGFLLPPEVLDRIFWTSPQLLGCCLHSSHPWSSPGLLCCWSPSQAGETASRLPLRQGISSWLWVALSQSWSWQPWGVLGTPVPSATSQLPGKAAG